jgi:hypothetical protein
VAAKRAAVPLGLAPAKAAPVLGLAVSKKPLPAFGVKQAPVKEEHTLVKSPEETVSLKRPASDLITDEARVELPPKQAKLDSMQIMPAPNSKPKIDLSKAVVAAASTPLPMAAPKFVRSAGGEVWEDATLSDWDPSHYRLFVGNLGPEVSESVLQNAFSSSYPSVSRVKIIKDKHSGKTRGYGFVAFAVGRDYLKALKEMPGHWIGNRQCIIKKSDWQSRNATEGVARNYQ